MLKIVSCAISDQGFFGKYEVQRVVLVLLERITTNFTSCGVIGVLLKNIGTTLRCE